jgi:hypothetical protein
MPKLTSLAAGNQATATISAPDSTAITTTETTVQGDYEPHPAASIFPMMSNEDFTALKEDIRAHGQLEDVVLLDGKVLDGRHRLRACRELGIAPRRCELTECDDPIACVLSKNLHRRHLSQSQRAQCAADVAKLRKGGDRKSDDFKGSNDPSIAEAAKAFQVSEPSVKRAKHVSDHGDKAVVDAVKAGSSGPLQKTILCRKDAFFTKTN